MNPKVTIIVPFYNVSNYFERCLLSLFNQTFDSIEFIFINDGSTDDSEQILKGVLNKNQHKIEQTTILNNTKNEGVIATKIRGINIASGDYILMIDADDYIDNRMVEILYKEAIDKEADMVVSDIYIEYGYKTVLFENTIAENNIDDMKSLLSNTKISASLCSKLIRRDLLIEAALKLPKGINYGEDKLILFYVLFIANKVTRIDQAFYHYIQYNSISITRSTIDLHFENKILFWNQCELFLNSKNLYPEFEDLIAQTKIQEKAQLMIRTNSKKLRIKYRNIFGDSHNKHIKNLKTGEKLMLFLIRYKLYNLSQCLRNVLVLKNKKPIQT
jgi:glycosyltransferase involved in cell wall biosynthesis